ncbi:hypothetical protein IKZ40_00450 [bacterium]|nr:hypothetical protein [bacterium]
MSAFLLMLAALFLQIATAKLLGGNFCDFLTPVLLFWTITQKPQLLFIWTLLMGILVSVIFPQPVLVLLLGFVLAQWLFRVSFFEDWRARSGMVFAAGAVFSFIWQGCGFIYAAAFADILSSPLAFSPLLSSILTAGLMTTLFFYAAGKKAEMEGRAW